MHRDFNMEKEHLKNTCLTIEEQIIKLEKETADLRVKVEESKRSSGGAFSNEIVTYIELLNSKTRKLNILKQAISKPYFGRIDFKQLMNDEPEIFYIGKTNVEDKHKMIVLDWRAPISGLYYSGEIGEVMYQAPGGAFIGDLTLKRQYEIEERSLISVFDKGLTPMDEYLFSALSEKKDNRLKDIVTTIQGEQNDIIRADRYKTLIVQGSAGSGKTTIVLHRIAYLLYTYQEVLSAENILVIVPNALFLNYISDVLPDLGVTDINQTTYQRLIESMMKKKFTVEKSETKLLKMLDHQKYTKQDRENLQLVSKFKGSLIMKTIIDDYVNSILSDFVPDEDVTINDHIVYEKDEIKKMFYDELSYLPLLPRIDKITSYMKNTLKNRMESIEKIIDSKYMAEINGIKKRSNKEDDIKEELMKVYDARDEKINQMKIASKTCIVQYFDKWKKIDVEKVYKMLVTDETILKKYTKDYRVVSDYCKDVFGNDKYEIEDLTPIMYLHMLLINSNVKKYKHIVIDEAQDYSPFQMYIINKLNITSSFTIVGDISQGIHSFRGIDNWSELMKDIFEDKYLKYLTLKKCYRSTIEIMDLANSVLAKFPTEDIILSEPVIRHGDEPSTISCDNKEEMINSIEENIKTLSGKGNKSVAVICKSSKESEKVYNELKNRGLDVKLLTDKDVNYSGGILVMPVHLAKGLEFDCVLIYNCSKDNYPLDNICIKLLYVAITRALHNVFIYYTGEKSQLII
ncbi:RNA polymerase recycling motor HelD [Clostridiaceae bacterium M8S5]|nr:RNA polymerase recycling motor HelD [Clostridiaceae bacterium M8S5]